MKATPIPNPVSRQWIVGRRANQVRDLIQKTFNGYFEMSVE